GHAGRVQHLQHGQLQSELVRIDVRHGRVPEAGILEQPVLSAAHGAARRPRDVLRRRVMACKPFVAFVAATALGVSLSASLQAQGRREDYARAQKFLNDEVKKIAYDGQVDAHWLGDSTEFWYLKDALESKEFVIVDAASGTKHPAFDHQRLAA